METEEHIRRKQAMVNSTSRKMSPQVSFTGASVNIFFYYFPCRLFFSAIFDIFLYLLQENGQHVSDKTIVEPSQSSSCKP